MSIHPLNHTESCWFQNYFPNLISFLTHLYQFQANIWNVPICWCHPNCKKSLIIHSALISNINPISPVNRKVLRKHQQWIRQQLPKRNSFRWPTPIPHRNQTHRMRRRQTIAIIRIMAIRWYSVKRLSEYPKRREKIMNGNQSAISWWSINY